MRARFDPALIPTSPNLEFELPLWQAGTRLVAGLDEAGRGALAGPVFAAALILPPEPARMLEVLAGVRDSKQLSAPIREALAGLIKAECAAWGLGWAEAEEIDRLGIARASRVAFCRALEGLAQAPEHLLLDYFRLPEEALPQTSLVKGDQRSLSIACASILAKTARDARMRAEDVRFPGYGFGRNKGYGTEGHRRAIGELGACPLHRKSFRLEDKFWRYS
ncbi:MAG TPA: ribonuclease HII [Anaerolineaceae bacterium]|nr:ribonuclease HII [Anaerolineaceae bacterium]